MHLLVKCCRTGLGGYLFVYTLSTVAITAVAP